MNVYDDVVGSCYNLMSRRKVNYTNIYDHVMDDEIIDKNHQIQLLQNAVSNMNKEESTQLISKRLTGIILTQMSSKSGIKKHGKTAIDALYDYFLVG